MNLVNIDLIRIFALFSVIGYHLAVPNLSYGYLGVDAFFCISGYLCALIWTQGRDDFNPYHFLNRRAIRIIGPSLVAVAIFTPIFIYITPLRDLIDIGQSILAQLLFVSNILFFIESDYFDIASEFKPFVHYWSLSVELQFYALLSTLYLVCKNGKLFYRIVSLLWIVSFLLWFLDSDLDRKFFWSSHRLWEFLSGVLLFELKNIIKLKNYILVIFTFLFSLSLFFKVLNFSIIVFVCIMLLYKFPSNIFRNSQRYVSSMAKSSYSIYIVHQPIIVVLRYLGLESTLNSYVIVSIIFFCAFLFYRFEKFYHLKSVIQIKSRIYSILLLYILILIMGVVSTYQPSTIFQDRQDTEFSLFDPNNARDCLNVIGDFDYNKLCTKQPKIDNNQPSFFILGDSHANSLFSGFDERYGSATDFSLSGCPFVFGVRRVDDKDHSRCEKYIELVRDFLVDRKSRNEVLVFYSRLDQYYWGHRFKSSINGREPGPQVWTDIKKSRSVDDASRKRELLLAIEDTIKFFRRHGYKVLLVTPTPSSGQPLPVLVNRKNIIDNNQNLPEIYVLRNEYFDRVSPVWNVFQGLGAVDGGVFVYDSGKLFCRDVRCFLNNASELFFYDSHHMTSVGAAFLWQGVFEEIAR